MLSGLPSPHHDEVLVGLNNGDDAAAVRLDGDTALLSTADFFTPVVDDAYDWGRIAAANALSDIYAMGGTPKVAINLVGWPRRRCRWSCSPRCCAAVSPWPSRPAVR